MYYHLSDFKLVISFSRYREIKERSMSVLSVLGHQFQVGVHIEREQLEIGKSLILINNKFDK